MVFSPASAAYVFPIPSNLKVVGASTTTLDLDWDDVSGAEVYRVQYSTSSSMSSAKYLRFTESQGQLTGLTKSKRYYVRVAVIDPDSSAKLSDYTGKPYPYASTTASQYPGGYDYPVPANLRSTGGTDTSLDLDWDDVSGAPEYRVQYSTASSMSSAKYASFNSSNGRISGLKASTTYYVRVAVTKVNAGSKLSDYTQTPYPTARTQPTPGGGSPTDITVGSFNIRGVNNDKGDPSSDTKSWKNRRPAVIEDIVGQDADVVGLQEANQSSIYDNYLVDGANQYLDLVNGLEDKGGSWAVTVPEYYNCARPTSSNNCSYVDHGASNATRIVYRDDRLEMLDAGSVKYSTQANETDRYLAWAKFKVRTSGKTFSFFTTHLSPSSESVRVSQWNQLIREVNRISAGDTVVVTGDFNTTKYKAPTQTLLPAMKSAGYGDVLNQSYNQNPPTGIRARTVVKGWVNSFNDFARDIDGGSKCYCTSQSKIGNNIDWVFASNNLAVKRWETVADLNSSFDQIGQIASDHFMVSATLTLP